MADGFPAGALRSPQLEDWAVASGRNPAAREGDNDDNN